MKETSSMTKRLFLFAGYHPNSIIDDALVYYVRSLSEFGDIVVCMDNNTPESELSKIKPFTTHAFGIRHGEYDFGSYKRAYLWALENLTLSDYDFVYIVNDSVYGPLYPLGRYFNAMEHMGHNAFGMVKKSHKKRPHIQSWFIGLTPDIFLTQWFNIFMQKITKLQNKGQITYLYENGLTKLITKHGHTWDCLYTVKKHGVYNNIKKLYCSGMPFMKKVAFTRKHGGLGAQVLFVLNKLDSNIRQIILQSAYKQYGEVRVKKTLTNNKIIIAFRNIKHAIYKFFIEGL